MMVGGGIPEAGARAGPLGKANAVVSESGESKSMAMNIDYIIDAGPAGDTAAAEVRHQDQDTKIDIDVPNIDANVKPSPSAEAAESKESTSMAWISIQTPQESLQKLGTRTKRQTRKMKIRQNLRFNRKTLILTTSQHLRYRKSRQHRT